MAATLLAGLMGFAYVTLPHYPIEHWLLWRYGAYWMGCVLWAAAVLSAGDLVVSRVLGRGLATLEHYAIAFISGVFVFELAVFGLAAVGLTGTMVFFAVPLALIAVGGVPLLLDARVRWRSRTPSTAIPAWGYVAIALGLLALLALYLLILTPHNVQFDARWKQMALSEDIVAHGGLRRFPEAWQYAVRPHFTSMVYAWAFMLPSGELFDQMELAQHLEFVVFGMTTLVAIPALVEKLAPDADGRLVWVARFLFPGVFVYDGIPSGGSDHFAAAFAVPIVLVFLRCWDRLEPRACGMLGGLLAGSLLVKYTAAVQLVPFPVVAIAGRAAWLGFRALRTRDPAGWAWLLGPLAATVAAVVLSAPHWLKNWVWYGDPLYPTLSDYFTPIPWTPDATYRWKHIYVPMEMWAPERNLDGYLESLRTLFTFSFEPHNWPRFHGDKPVFGSLFSLLLLTLPFLKGTRRIWVLMAYIHLAIFAWFNVHHQDRYLQALVPLMAAATAAIIYYIWKQHGWLVRVPLLALIAFQIAWGADCYFFETHAMSKSSLRKTLDLLSSAHKGRYDRFKVQAQEQKIGRHLPKDARVLLHDISLRLGVGRETATDTAIHQYGISYGLQADASAVHRLLRSMGITHVYWRHDYSRSLDSVAADLRFFDYVWNHGRRVKKLGKGRLAKLPDQPPEASANDTVAVIACGYGYKSGLYAVEDLRNPIRGPDATPFPEPRNPATSTRHAVDQAVARAEHVVLLRRCADGQIGKLEAQFRRVAKRRKREKHPAYEIWLRRH